MEAHPSSGTCHVLVMYFSDLPRKFFDQLVSKWVVNLQPTYIKWGIPWGYNPLILTSLLTSKTGHASNLYISWELHFSPTPGPGAEATEATEAADGQKSEVRKPLGKWLKRLGKWNF